MRLKSVGKLSRNQLLQNSQPPEHVRQLFPLLQRLARLVLARNLFQSTADDFLLRVVRDDDHTIDIAEDEVAPTHAHTGAHHRDVSDPPFARRLWYRVARSRRRTLEIAYRGSASRHARGRLSRIRPRHAPAGGGEQFSPGGDAFGGAVARQHDHLAGRELIDERDFHLVGVVTRGGRCYTGMYRPVRARPKSCNVSSSGRMNGFIACCINPRLSSVSESTAVFSDCRMVGIIGMVSASGERVRCSGCEDTELTVTNGYLASAGSRSKWRSMAIAELFA